MSNELIYNGEKSKNFSNTNANHKIFLKSNQSSHNFLNAINKNKLAENKCLNLNSAKEKNDTLDTLSNKFKKQSKICLIPKNVSNKKLTFKASEFKNLSKIANNSPLSPVFHKSEHLDSTVLQKSYCPAPLFRRRECPHDPGSQKYEPLKKKSSGRGEGPQKTEKVVKNEQKKTLSKITNVENPPHMYCNWKKSVSKQGPGGGEDKMSVAFCPGVEKLMANTNDSFCSRKALSKMTKGENRPLTYCSQKESVSKKGPGGGRIKCLMSFAQERKSQWLHTVLCTVILCMITPTPKKQ